MPPYQTTPFKETPRLLIPGTPFICSAHTMIVPRPRAVTSFQISAVTTTGTVTFQITDGNPPVVGALITVRGAANSSNFNVTNGIILTVTTDTTTGVCTVTYAIASTTQATLADHGEVSIPQPEIGETLLNGASAPVAVSTNAPEVNQGKSLTVNVSFPIAPTATTVVLQGANFDIDSEYVTIAPLSARPIPQALSRQDRAQRVRWRRELSELRFYRVLVSLTQAAALS